MSIREHSIKLAQDFERRMLSFAAEFETLRVYACQWTRTVTDDYGCRIDFCDKFFPYSERRLAFELARGIGCDCKVHIYNFKKLAQMPDYVFDAIRSPNRDVATAFRDKFKELRCIEKEPNWISLRDAIRTKIW